MADRLRTDAAGTPVDLIGQPLTAGRGAVPGVVIQESSTMPKADRDGVYRIGKAQFKVRKGGFIPEGAELIEEQRAESRAPENKSKAAAPENRAKKAD